MDKYGPGYVVIAANVLVTLGALCQALADGPSTFWLLMVGRVLLGLGGEVTPFTSVEILGKLFPEYFGLMAGVRNLVQSSCGFLAFVLLPMWAASGSGPEPVGYNATQVRLVCNDGIPICAPSGACLIFPYQFNAFCYVKPHQSRGI